MKTLSSANSLEWDRAIRDRPTSIDTPGALRQNKKKRLLFQHTYTPGKASRRFYAQVAIKFQDNTIIPLSGQATYGPKRSWELADEIADGWVTLMTHLLDRPDAIAAFLKRATPPISVDDSNVTSSISPDDVRAALKKL